MTICNHESPALVRLSDVHHHGILKCITYKARAEEGIPELQPGRGEDGLFPGQIRR